MEDATTRYEGQDTRTTSHRELYGWYSYGLAAEVFTVCGVGTLSKPSSSELHLINLCYRLVLAFDARISGTRSWSASIR